jgi:hypothetical protein
VDAAPALSALRSQAADLVSVRNTLAQVRHTLPESHGAGVWNGPANRLYRRALDSLEQQVSVASESVDRSLRRTQQAIRAVENAFAEASESGGNG